MKTRHYLAATLAALACGFVAPTLHAQGMLIYTCNYEAPGDFTPGLEGGYSQVCYNIDTCERDGTCPGTDSLAILSAPHPVRAGNRAVRVTLAQGNISAGGKRAEMQSDCPSPGYLHENKVDFWYGWSIFVPTDWTFTPTKTVVHQVHTGGDQQSGSPIIGLRIEGSNWTVTGERDGENEPGQTHASVPLQRGQWTDFVFHVRWSWEPDGHPESGELQVWKDGVMIVDLQNYRTLDVEDENYPALQGQKWGMYGLEPGDGTRVLYYDEIRVAKGPGDLYLLVAPGGGGGGPPPAAPASLVATAVSATEVGLSWPDVADETQYRIERKSTGSFLPLATKTANSTSHSDTTAVGGITYTYRIRAENSFGGSTWTESNSVTPPGGGDVTSGLLGWWKFNETSGTAAADSSGNGQNGTLSGFSGTYWTDTALSFAEDNDYVDVPNLSFTGAFTLSIWTYRDDVSADNVIWGEDTGAAGGGPKISYRANGKLQVRLVSTADEVVTAPAVGGWHHLVIKRDSSNKVDAHVDGGPAVRLFGDVAQAGTFTLDKIGANGSPSQYYDGKLDDARVFNRTLSAGEVSTLFANGRNFSGGGGGTPEINVTGNGATIADGDTTPGTSDHTDFGSANVTGGTVDRVFTIQNTGTAALSVGTVSAGGDFAVTVQPASSVAASGSTTFTVRFDPTTTGVRTASVSFSNGDSDENPYNFLIQGTGTSTATPEINVTGNSTTIADGDTTPSTSDHTDFGSANVTGGTVDRVFTIQNTGTAALTVGTVSAGGDFSVTAQPASSVAASGSTTFTVRFDPTTTGVRTASISFSNGDSDENPYNFSIQGTGTGTPEINVTGNGATIADGDTTPATSDHTDFGSTDIASGTVSRTFTIQNTGTGALAVGTVSVSGTHAADFSITTQPATSVAASGNTTFVVEFNPSATGARTASLSFSNDDANENPYNFSIQGTGTTGDTSLKLWLKFNETSGTTAADSSGNGNNGTLSGFSGTYWTDTALSFAEDNDYVDVPNLALTGAFTLSIWTYHDDRSTTNVIWGEDSGSSGGGPKVYYATDGKIGIRVAGTDDKTVSAPALGGWHHVVIKRDASNKVDVHIDGGSAVRLYGDAAQSGTFTLDKIGANGSASQYFDGKLDDVRAYDRTLSASEVSALFSAGRQ